jgi:hypothetical protein
MFDGRQAWNYRRSSHQPNQVGTEKHAAIKLGISPERDREIEAMQTLIRNCAVAGVTAVKYNLTLLGVLRNRNEPLPGRGDTAYRRCNLKRSLETGGPVNRKESPSHPTAAEGPRAQGVEPQTGLQHGAGPRSR